MPTDVVMPRMGESINEGTITRWLKKSSDAVQKDEPLFEISTDKVDAEIPSPAAGILGDLKFSPGATVQVDMVVAVIDGYKDLSEAAPKSTAVPGLAASANPMGVAQVDRSSDGKPTRCSPLARRIAKENNIDVYRIPGAGFESRITKEDVPHHLSLKRTDSTALPLTVPLEPRGSSSSDVTIPPTGALVAPTAGPLNKSDLMTPPAELTPMTKIRSSIAQRMVESVKISPHVHTIFKVDMTRIVHLREREKDKYQERNGLKLVYMPFIVFAAVKTLRKLSIVNASVESGAIRYHQNINLGIAVALEWGLIVPVVKQAEERNFLGFGRAIADLADRARTKRLMPEEASGATFKLTNSGIFGEEFGTPIINQPESSILAIGALKKEPIVLSNAEGNGSIAIRSVQHFCLGFDHRIIDGADAGRFMSAFKKTLDDWDQEIG